jgi:hypothetical protein
MQHDKQSQHPCKSDSDSNPDSDSDSNPDSNADSDSNPDSNSNSNSNSDSNTDSNTDSDSNSNSNSDTDSRQRAADFDNRIPNRGGDCKNRNYSHHHWNCERCRRRDGAIGSGVGGRRRQLQRCHGDDRLEL